MISRRGAGRLRAETDRDNPERYGAKGDRQPHFNNALTSCGEILEAAVAARGSTSLERRGSCSNRNAEAMTEGYNV